MGESIFRVQTLAKKQDVALAKNGMWLNLGCRAANGGDKRRAISLSQNGISVLSQGTRGGSAACQALVRHV